jgi:hypothetical protein
MNTSSTSVLVSGSGRRLLVGTAVGTVLLLLALGAVRTAEAAPTCSTWQGWQYCGESQVFQGGPPGYGAASWKVEQYGYTHPCVYVSFKVGTEWFPQGDLCQDPYVYFVHQGSPDAVCIFAKHWIRDFANTSPKLTTYICP